MNPSDRSLARLIAALFVLTTLAGMVDAYGAAPVLRGPLADIHRHGIVFGDLHGKNILVDEQDRVSLIDFELAVEAGSGDRPGLGAPGFRAPADRHGFEIDEHALAALRLWLFLPLVMLLELAPAVLPEYKVERFSDRCLPRSSQVTVRSISLRP